MGLHANLITGVKKGKKNSRSNISQKKLGVASIDAPDAAVVKGMLSRGDRQHDIAAWFGVNGGRIAEIHSGEKFEHIRLHNEDFYSILKRFKKKT